MRTGGHGKRLGGTDVHCEEALPVTANDSAAGTEVFEDSCGKLDTFDRGLWSNTGSLYNGGLRDKWNGVNLAVMDVGQRGEMT
jgi:hypothetical protein